MVQDHPQQPSPALPASTQADPPPPPPSPPPLPPPQQQPFDPSRMIGIIKRKALIKELAAVYHAECLAYCQELLELQRKWEEAILNLFVPSDCKLECLIGHGRLMVCFD
ncbi:hypothetical protein I3843_09G116200 [Carya illinoinensis]|uniref:Uncharacterized protein n=1 Tax=Carya illinoinensis TaxID=32201 RepID=A0A8T1PJG4_CARIL|nr:hypothetical protein I3760_09G116700 [Carya illinoinensis]KAG6642118.1 hypothetical protein CIPAW_09G121000 [Carya illinoinensis]KAG6695866.1 hypothetical protein I3842_09G118500 [Carya illinoinensis]KAG7963412.1 hypothetical protein I3843_09G116200 [Carya illinoinensis]